jgi:hypothetical protein
MDGKQDHPDVICRKMRWEDSFGRVGPDSGGMGWCRHVEGCSRKHLQQLVVLLIQAGQSVLLQSLTSATSTAAIPGHQLCTWSPGLAGADHPSLSPAPTLLRPLPSFLLTNPLVSWLPCCRRLNLSSNQISRLEGIWHLSKLEALTLQVSVECTHSQCCISQRSVLYLQVFSA